MKCMPATNPDPPAAPNALKLVNTVEQCYLSVAGDRKGVRVWGISRRRDDVLLIADRDNCEVKELVVTTKKVSVIFKEAPVWYCKDAWGLKNSVLKYNCPIPDLYMSNVREYSDGKGNLLVVTEGLQAGTRCASLARHQDEANSYTTQQTFSLEPSEVLLFLTLFVIIT